MPDEIQSSLQHALASVADWLADARLPAVIVGGVAVSLLGRPRLTRDIDALADLAEERWPMAIASAAKFGLEPRLADVLEFARRARVLLLRHVDSSIDVDVILGLLPFERTAVAHGQERLVGNSTLRLPRVEDLMVMKAIARRARLP